MNACNCCIAAVKKGLTACDVMEDHYAVEEVNGKPKIVDNKEVRRPDAYQRSQEAQTSEKEVTLQPIKSSTSEISLVLQEIAKKTGLPSEKVNQYTFVFESQEIYTK